MYIAVCIHAHIVVSMCTQLYVTCLHADVYAFVHPYIHTLIHRCVGGGGGWGPSNSVYFSHVYCSECLNACMLACMPACVWHTCTHSRWMYGMRCGFVSSQPCRPFGRSSDSVKVLGVQPRRSSMDLLDSCSCCSEEKVIEGRLYNAVFRQKLHR